MTAFARAKAQRAGAREWASSQCFVDEGEGALLEAVPGGGGASRRGPCPVSTASPCTVDQMGYSMPSRRAVEHARVDQLVERGAKMTQGRAVLPGSVVRGVVGVRLRQRERGGEEPGFLVRELQVRGSRSRPADRRAAAASPYGPCTRATPAAMRSASSRMAAAQTAARSSSRSAKCR